MIGLTSILATAGRGQTVLGIVIKYGIQGIIKLAKKLYNKAKEGTAKTEALVAGTAANATAMMEDARNEFMSELEHEIDQLKDNNINKNEILESAKSLFERVMTQMDSISRQPDGNNEENGADTVRRCLSNGDENKIYVFNGPVYINTSGTQIICTPMITEDQARRLFVNAAAEMYGKNNIIDAGYAEYLEDTVPVAENVQEYSKVATPGIISAGTADIASLTAGATEESLEEENYHQIWKKLHDEDFTS